MATELIFDTLRYAQTEHADFRTQILDLGAQIGSYGFEFCFEVGPHGLDFGFKVGSKGLDLGTQIGSYRLDLGFEVGSNGLDLATEMGPDAVDLPLKIGLGGQSFAQLVGEARRQRRGEKGIGTRFALQSVRQFERI